MARTDVVFLVLTPDSPYHAECVDDPLLFLERRQASLYATARRRLHGQGVLPLAAGSPWGVVLPGDAPDVAAIAEMYGAELADKTAQACAESPAAVVLWHVVEVVPKGCDGAEQPTTWKGPTG